MAEPCNGSQASVSAMSHISLAETNHMGKPNVNKWGSMCLPYEGTASHMEMCRIYHSLTGNVMNN